MKIISIANPVVVACALSVGLIAGAQSQDGLLAYYPFDNGSAADMSGPVVYDGVKYGATTTADRCGNPDKALLFDGVDDYVDISVIHTGINRDENTISMWFRPDDTPFGCLYTQWHRHTICNNSARAVTGTGWNVWVPIPPGEDRVLTNNPVFQAGEWYHVALTFSKSGMAAALYVNGGLVDTGSYLNSYGLAFFTSSGYAKFSLARLVDFGGGGNPSSRYYLNGALDDVRIHNRALSADEILALSVPTFTCEGFLAPLDGGPVTVRRNSRKALPLKATLYDCSGSPVTDLDLTSPPLVQVLPNATGSIAAEDVTAEAIADGLNTEGNQFFFDDDGRWHLNLKTTDYSGVGTYTISMVTGDANEYAVESCVAEFVRQE